MTYKAHRGGVSMMSCGDNGLLNGVKTHLSEGSTISLSNDGELPAIIRGPTP